MSSAQLSARCETGIKISVNFKKKLIEKRVLWFIIFIGPPSCHSAHSALSWSQGVSAAHLQQRGGARLESGSRGAATWFHPQLHHHVLEDRSNTPE